MKTIEDLSIMDRARYLHRWFPDEIPALLDYVEVQLTKFQTEKPPALQTWVVALYTPERETEILAEVIGNIKSNSENIKRYAKLFAELVFHRLIYCYTVYCVIEFAKSRKPFNPRFCLAVELFFPV